MKIANAQLWVQDQEEALAFWTEKVGFEVRADVTHAGDGRLPLADGRASRTGGRLGRADGDPGRADGDDADAGADPATSPRRASPGRSS